jgi:hypothetical protein
MNKKANMDGLMIPMLLFFIGVGIYVGYLIISSGLTAFSGDATANSLLINGQTMMTRIGNNGFFFIAVALILFNVIGAFLLLTHPIFVIIDIILLPFSAIVAAVMSNAWEASMHLIPTITTAFPIMDAIMMNLMWVMLVADVFAAIAGYAFIKQ